MALPLFHPDSSAPTPLLLDLQEFREAFPEESELVEFKQGLSADQIEQVAVAFSNANGGVIVIGVSPSGRIVGVPATSATRDRIYGALARAHGLGRISLNVLPVEQTHLAIIGVARRRQGAAQTGDGRVLVRRGTEKVPLFGEELLAFLNERALGSFELTETTASINDADEAALGVVAGAFRWSDDIPSRLRERRLVTADDRLTVAGALLLLADPDEVLGKAHVEIRRISTSGGSELRLVIRGPVQVQIDETVRELRRELGVESVIVGARRRDLPRIPDRALREVIANAVAHRSYETRGTAVVVEIHPQEVRVRSPGPLPEPVTVANIRDTQAARNPVVIEALRRLHLAEDEGAGVDRIIDDMRSELLGDPVFEDNGSQVIVRLSTRSAVTSEERAWLLDLEENGAIDANDRVLLVYAARGETLSNARARELLSLTESAARTRLRRLVEQGLLVRRGERSATTYAISAELGRARPLTPQEYRQRVLTLAAENATITNASVRARTGLDRTEALRLLRGLVTEGMLAFEGSGRGARYRLAPRP